MAQGDDVVARLGRRLEPPKRPHGGGDMTDAELAANLHAFGERSAAKQRELAEENAVRRAEGGTPPADGDAFYARVFAPCSRRDGAVRGPQHRKGS